MNYGAIIVASVAMFVIGGAWYSPALFGHQWMRAVGMSKAEVEKAKKRNMAPLFVATFIGSLLMNYVFYNFIGDFSWRGGINTALLLWVGFAVPISLSPVLWENKDKNLFFINASNYLVSLLVAGLIMGLWV